MKKPRIYRKKCRTCGAAFSGPKLAAVKSRLARHDCAAEQRKKAANRMFASMMQGAMLGVLGRFLSAAVLEPFDGPYPLPKGAILPPPVPGGKRTKNPAFPHHGKSRVSPVEKGRRKPPSQ